MCYNLGVSDDNKAKFDYMVPARELIGDSYQWGAKVPGWNMPGRILTANAYADANGKKTAQDPCPAGYRIPTGNEWQGVISSNTKTLLGTAAIGQGGMKFGDNLMLVYNALMTDSWGNVGAGNLGQYMGSTYQDVSGPSGWGLGFKSGGRVSTAAPSSNEYYPIRCISEY